MSEEEDKTIFVGVSGGVDSSVAAALLQDQGHDVVGVFIRTWQPDWIECTWQEERRDAMRVCAHLDIPFVELDLEKEYKTGVADYMISEYKKGRTPNPDVMCNREVKFGGFLKWALAQGAGLVATGHYAQNIFNTETGFWEMHRGVDESKDQSYFLWTLKQEQLKHIIFPVGSIPKLETRKLAEKYNLPTATKKDSQGICFIGEINMKDFLSHYIDEKPGDVLDTKGEVIGKHSGALFFTKGERHGFLVTKKTTDDKPYYVIDKDIEKNTITVSPSLAAAPETKKVKLEDVVWGSVAPLVGKTYHGQIRYHGEKKNLTFSALGQKTAEVTLEKPDATITSGQSLVIYNGDICLGGGVIV